MKKFYVLYDGRAKLGNTDDATVIDSAETEKEAKRASKELWDGYDAIWCEYDCDGDNLINETFRRDISP